MRRLIFCAVLLLVVSAPVAADETCFKCAGAVASCDAVTLQDHFGRVTCSGGWTDCHDGSGNSTCPHHCHASVAVCEGTVLTLECYNTMSGNICITCQDRNFNGECDDREPPPGDEGSPIVFNLGGRSWRGAFTGDGDTVLFDITGDGIKERVTWTAADSGVAFLAVDKNRNGIIDDVRELFGSYTPPGTKGGQFTGFDALSWDDHNGDSVIDARDPAAASYLFWTDANHDGISQSAELVNAFAAGLQSIDVRAQRIGREDRFGNDFRLKGKAVIDWQMVNVYDVYFRILP